jgi:hypothetical protein
MIDTTLRPSLRLQRTQVLEGCIEGVDLQNRRLHIRTGSRDRFGACVQVPEDCDIHHESFELALHSLLPWDAVNIHYTEDAAGQRVAQRVEVCA